MCKHLRLYGAPHHSFARSQLTNGGECNAMKVMNGNEMEGSSSPGQQTRRRLLEKASITTLMRQSFF